MKSKAVDGNLIDLSRRREAREPKPTMDLALLDADEHEVLSAILAYLKMGKRLGELMFPITGEHRNKNDRLSYSEHRVYQIILEKMTIKK
jgi:hypothetical protein